MITKSEDNLGLPAREWTPKWSSDKARSDELQFTSYTSVEDCNSNHLMVESKRWPLLLNIFSILLTSLQLDKVLLAQLSSAATEPWFKLTQVVQQARSIQISLRL